jgi:opacity protein-like surface antigen
MQTWFVSNRFRAALPRGVLVAGLLLLPSVALAQSQGPTLMDLFGASRRAPPAASAPPPTRPAAAPPTTAPATALLSTEPPAASSRGWYMRADGNIGLYVSSSQKTGNCATTALVELCGYSANGNAAEVLGVTFGGGYRWTAWLRTDATYSYRAARQAGGGFGALGGSPAVGVAFASPRASTFFFNAQVDVVPALGFATGWFQPYIGAGFGPSINDSGDVPVTGTLPVGFSAFTLPGHTQTSLAWNAGAGMAIRLTGDFALDFGYRYVDLGTFTTGSTVAGSPPVAVQPLRWTLQQHELYAGFRLTFN